MVDWFHFWCIHFQYFHSIEHEKTKCVFEATATTNTTMTTMTEYWLAVQKLSPIIIIIIICFHIEHRHFYFLVSLFPFSFSFRSYSHLLRITQNKWYDTIIYRSIYIWTLLHWRCFLNASDILNVCLTTIIIIVIFIADTNIFLASKVKKCGIRTQTFQRTVCIWISGYRCDQNYAMAEWQMVVQRYVFALFLFVYR